jgi:hypothetical protein
MRRDEWRGTMILGLGREEDGTGDDDIEVDEIGTQSKLGPGDAEPVVKV